MTNSLPKEGSKALYICFGFSKAEDRDLLEQWLDGKKWIFVPFVGIRLQGEKIPDEDLTFAIKTARQVPQSKFGKFLKRLFLQLQYRWVYHKLVKSQASHVITYNGMKGVHYLVTVAIRQLGLKQQFWEIAPLPNRLQIDSKGINWGSSIPRESSFYDSLEINKYPNGWRNASLQLRKPRRGSKIQHIEGKEASLKLQKYVFVPLQVPTDSQISIYGGWIHDLAELIGYLALLSKELPDGYHFKLKEHPSSNISLTSQIKAVESDRLILDNQTNTLDLMYHSSCLLTVNSSAGLEAFHYEKPVITLGQAFYSFGNLTRRAHDLNELKGLVKTVDTLDFSADERDRFLRFLYYWFPTRSSIKSKQYTLSSLCDRDCLLNQDVAN